jgi:hypothetical protein
MAETTPTLALFLPLASSSKEPGGFDPQLRELGWSRYLAGWLQPQLDWAEESGAEVQLVAHLPFGQFDGDMRIDAYDACVAGGLTWVTRNFAKAWKPYTSAYKSIAYIGDAAQMPWMPWAQLAGMARRTFKPLKEAGFSRVCIDASGDAINQTLFNHPTAGEILRGRNNVLIELADQTFGRGTTLIEPTPRREALWKPLQERDVCVDEDFWRRNHGQPGEIGVNAAAKLYGERSYIKGRVHRIVDSLEAAQRVAREGDVPLVKTWKLASAGVKASAVLEGGE